MNREELAWAAGFFDGEGCASLSAQRGPASTPSPRLSIAQVDPRPLYRLQSAIGRGTIRTTTPANPNHRQQWILTVSGWRGAQAVIAMLWGFLSEPKREQARRVLLVGRSAPPRNARRTHCKRGHPMVGDNVLIVREPHGKDGIGRRCRTCYYAGQKASRAARQARAPLVSPADSQQDS